MKKILSTLGLALVAAAANADITVTVPETLNGKEYSVNVISIADYAKVLRGEARFQNVVAADNGIVAAGRIVLEDPAEPACYMIEVGNVAELNLFAAPKENINAEILSVNPVHIDYSGTPLMDGVNLLNHLVEPLEADLQAASDAENGEECDRIVEEMEKIYANYVTLHPGSPAAAYAMMEISDPKKAIEAFGLLGTELQKISIVYPLAEAQLVRQERAYQEQLAVDAMKGKPAPAFTLPNMDGKKVSLSQFKGKWVILDFWGSWCKWCIKGMPALKEAYKQYDGKVEVIGIDCRDSEEQWKTAVEKLGLPWVHVFNGDGKDITTAYHVRGYPTKVIIDPEGNLVDVVVGEDPSFFTTLQQLVEGK